MVELGSVSALNAQRSPGPDPWGPSSTVMVRVGAPAPRSRERIAGSAGCPGLRGLRHATRIDAPPSRRTYNGCV